MTPEDYASLQRLILSHGRTTAFTNELVDLVRRHAPQIDSAVPNPHPPGSYLWARAEHRRGRDVRRKHWNTFGERLGVRRIGDPRGHVWVLGWYGDDDVNATDWEIAP